MFYSKNIKMIKKIKHWQCVHSQNIKTYLKEAKYKLPNTKHEYKYKTWFYFSIEHFWYLSDCLSV